MEEWDPKSKYLTPKSGQRNFRGSMTEPPMMTNFARALTMVDTDNIPTPVAETPTRKQVFGLIPNRLDLSRKTLSVIHEESMSSNRSIPRLASPKPDLETPKRITHDPNLPDPFVSNPPAREGALTNPCFQLLPLPLPRNITLSLSKGGYPMIANQPANTDSNMTVSQHYESEFQGVQTPYRGEQWVNPMTNCQTGSQYPSTVPHVGQDLYGYQPNIAPPFQAPYMSQDQNYMVPSQNYMAPNQNFMAQGPYMNQDQNYIGPNQDPSPNSFDLSGVSQGQSCIDRYPSTNFDLSGIPQGPPPQVPSYGGMAFGNLPYDPVSGSSHSAEDRRSKTPGRGRGQNNKNQKGSEYSQLQHQSNAIDGNLNNFKLQNLRVIQFGSQNATQIQNRPSTSKEYRTNSQFSMWPYSETSHQTGLSFGFRGGAESQIQSDASTGLPRNAKPNGQHVAPYTSMSFRGQEVQYGLSEGGAELGSVGPSNSNESKISVRGSGPSAVGTAHSNSSGIARPSSKLKIDPARGPPPAFLPGNTAAQKIATIQYKHSNIANSVGTPGSSVTSNGLPNVGQPIDVSGNSGPLVMAPTPRRNVSQTVYNVSPAAANPFSAIQPSSAAITPLRLQPQKKLWPSTHMAQISPDGAKPSLEVAFDPQNIPFMELGRRSATVDHGVIRISNVPYHITRAEIVAFLGRNARIINENDEPVHIIMERVTSKTMDAYVEFTNISEAVNAVNRYEQNRALGRPGRLGERHVDMEVSSQAQLMADLFPKARNVKWHSSRPEIIPVAQNDPYNSGFQGFLIREELIMMSKHVETPSRSPFSRDCPQRPWECLISTLIKFPWYMTGCITIEQRDMLFKTALFLVTNLNERINNEPEDVNINQRLLRRVLRACFRCAGFTESQKDGIAFTLGLDPVRCGLAIYADHWYPFSALGPKPGFAADVTLYYMALLRDATTSPALISLGERSADADDKPPCVFGNLKFDYPKNFGSCTLAYAAKIEWSTIDKLLRRVLPEKD